MHTNKTLRAALISFSCLSFVISAACGAQSLDNDELSTLYKDDQTERSQISNTSFPDWIAKNDTVRRNKVMAMLKGNRITTSNDHYKAAMIFQHGNQVEDIKLAFAMAQLAVALDGSNTHAKWLTAASWDRILMMHHQPQWFGTQYYQPKPNSNWELYTINENIISDEERNHYNIPSLDMVKDMAKKMN